MSKRMRRCGKRHDGRGGAIETVQDPMLPSLRLAEVQRLERERKALADRLEALETLVHSMTKR